MSKKNRIKPWLTERFCIGDKDRARFVARMESVLDVYQQSSFSEKHVLICMDEASRQIVSDVVEPLRRSPGKPQRVDDKYERHGVRALFMFYNPISGWRRVGCRDSRTRSDWAEEMRQLIEVDYPDAERFTVVCDNLNTHDVASFYHRFDAETASQLRQRVELVFTPKNGSWLNMAEMELSILSRQCLGSRRFSTAAELDREVATWSAYRNSERLGTNWRFTKHDARIKLKSLYPAHDT